MSERTVPELPNGTPRPIRAVYIAVACAAAFVSVAALGLNAVPQAKDGLTNALRALHVLSPPPVHDVGPLSTGWLPSGSTWASASHDYVEQAKAANPDYVVEFHPGREYTDSGPFNSNVRYRYEGSLTFTPRWQGIF